MDVGNKSQSDRPEGNFMFKKRIFSLVAVAALSISGIGISHASEGNNEIVGGGYVNNTSAYPWISYLSGNGYACTGQLVAPQWILSAAHCAQLGMSSVRIGSTDGNRGGDFYNLDGYKIHPEYRGTAASGGVNDIALFHMSRPSGIEPVQPSSPVYRGEQLRSIGYGEDSNGRLKGATGVYDDSPIRCRQYGLDPYRELCVTPLDGGTCRGDSGGPLLAYQENKWKLVGTTSRGGEYCNDVSIYENVNSGSLRNWVSANI